MDQTEKILTAAEAEFADKGFQKAGVASIAKKASIAVGSVYLSFPSKFELFKAVYLRVQQRRFRDMETRLDWSNPRQALRTMTQENITAGHDSKILAEWHSTKPGERLRADIGDMSFIDLEGRFLQWHRDGLTADGVTPQLLIELIDIARVADKAQVASTDTYEFLIDAVLEKMFPRT